MNYYEKSSHEVLEELKVNKDTGLSEQEASGKLEKDGKNVFAKQKKENIFIKILKIIADVSIIILLIAGVLSLYLTIDHWDTEGALGLIEPIVIFSIILLNICLSLYQESSAEKALEALTKLTNPIAKVIRDGREMEINTEDVVVGDIILLATGDLIPADARIIECKKFSVDESSLTGESEPSEKTSSIKVKENASLGDRKNMIYSGCLVVTGNAKAVVVATGMQTEMGKIAQFLNVNKKGKTPLQVRLDKVGKLISGIAIVSAIIMFVVGYYINEMPFNELLILTITLAVAAVPETLSLIVTLILTNGVKKMVHKNAIIRKIQAVETLGSTSIICSDKTGTLTMNKMSIKKLWLRDKKVISDDDEFDEEYEKFLKILVSASNATFGLNEEGQEVILGDSTESSIIRLMKKKGMDKDDINSKFKRVAEIPFSSARKFMTIIVEKPNSDGYIVISKGAFDRIPLREYSENSVRQFKEIHDSFAGDALRVISVGVKEISTLPDKKDLASVESNLSLLGFIGIIDPIRPEAKEAISKAKTAGIRTIMITGDHAITAKAIGIELGLIRKDEPVLTGSQLQAMSDEEFEANMDLYSVYARVSPEDKIRIVEAWQKYGEVVAMTGDGVNDAPALKAADVGIAMGINGTEVAKSAADMILTDDKFTTIVDAVEEGRNVFSNIRKLIYFLVVCNMSEIILMLFAVFVGRQIPLTPVMLLLINVIGDGIPGLALAKEVSDSRIMQRKPIARNESFFGGALMEVIIQQVMAFAVVSLAALWIGNTVNFGDMSLIGDVVPEGFVGVGQTMCFLVTGWSSILHTLTVRSRKSIFTYKFKDNPQLFISVFVMLLVLGSPVIILSFTGGSFIDLTGLDWQHWLVVIGLSLVPLLVAEYGKYWDYRKTRTFEKTRISQPK